MEYSFAKLSTKTNPFNKCEALLTNSGCNAMSRKFKVTRTAYLISWFGCATADYFASRLDCANRYVGCNTRNACSHTDRS